MKTKSRSLRTDLLLSLLASMLVMFGAVGFFANWVSQHEADEVFSARLATSARVLEALLTRQLQGVTIERPVVIDLPPALAITDDDQPTSEGHPYEGKIAFQAWSSEGRLLAKSARSSDQMLGPLEPGFHEQIIDAERWHVFVLKSGTIWIFAAEKHEVRGEMADEISLSILTPLIVGGLLLLLAVNVIALRSTRPLEKLANSISRRDPASLQPISIANRPQELEPVIHELNALLARVQESLSREQRFIDSAAHELRTPITALQLHVQNALSAPSPEEQTASIRLALDAARRAGKLAEQLLVYSRVSASASMEEKQEICLGDVCRDVVAMMAPIFQERDQQVLVQATTGDVIAAEKSKIERLIRNLLENASQYGKSPGVIGVTVSRTSTAVQLTIDNDGSPIPESEKQRVFIPYYRIPGTPVFGSGLGLAIAQEIVMQHAGKIYIEDKALGKGTRVVVTFPAILPR